VNGSIQEQSDTIVTFCKFITVRTKLVTVCRGHTPQGKGAETLSPLPAPCALSLAPHQVWLPALLSLVSLVLKTRYPLRTKDQKQMVRDGIKTNRLAASRAMAHDRSGNDDDNHAKPAAASDGAAETTPGDRGGGRGDRESAPPLVGRARRLSSDDIAKPTAVYVTADHLPQRKLSLDKAVGQAAGGQAVAVAQPDGDRDDRDARRSPTPEQPFHDQPATDPITRMPYRPLLTGLTHAEQRLLFTLLTFPQVWARLGSKRAPVATLCSHAHSPNAPLALGIPPLPDRFFVTFGASTLAPLLCLTHCSKVAVLRDLRANGPGPLVRRMAFYSLASGALSLGLFVGSIWSLRFLRTEEKYRRLSLVATLSATAFGHSLLLSVYAYVPPRDDDRPRGAKRLSPP
jgi:hypothetical protein